MNFLNNDIIEFDDCINKKEILIDNISDFFSFLHKNNNLEGFIFRGHQRSSYKLLSTIERNDKIDKVDREEYLKTILQDFKQSLRGRIDLPYHILNNDLEVWAIGQHYGLKTPLLDWTASPWIAMFFAFEDERKLEILLHKCTDNNINDERIKLNENRSIYALNAKVLNDKLIKTVNVEFNRYNDGKDLLLEPDKNCPAGQFSPYCTAFKAIEEYLPNQFDSKEYYKARDWYNSCKAIFPIIYSPSAGNNNRLVCQRGLFTYSYLRSIENSLYCCRASDWLKPNDPIILKIDFPNDFRTTVINHLYEMNISRLSLFPDISGAAAYQNWKIDRKIEKVSEN